MTISNAITIIDSVKPNQYTDSEKIRWLNDLDGKIKAEVIDTHESNTEVEFNGYDSTTPDDTKLLVDAPYDDIYVHWLESRIDYTNGEFAKYNNSISMFNSAIQSFISFYNRTHMPKGVKVKYF